MANLLSQDIGLNYKGLINIGSTINQNISTSLQYLTDGDGNNLPIQVSTTAVQLNYGVGVGGTPTNAGLHVYGQSGKTGLAFEGASAKMYIDLNGTGTNFFDSIESRFRNAAGTSLAMNVWGDLGRVAIGGLATNFTPSASLHVRGDGTNPIFRVEDNSGTARFSIPNAGAITTNSDISIPANNLFVSGSGSFSGTGSAAALYWAGSGSNGRVGVNSGGVFIDHAGTAKTNTSGTINLATLTSAFGAAAGSANYRSLSINYTINNSGAQTGSTTGIYLNATETALNSMTHNLMDLRVGGVSAFRVDRTGKITTATNYMTFGNGTNLLGVDVGGLLYFQGANRFSVSNTGVINGYNELRNTGNMFVGSIAVTPTARLHVRGDGTNPIFRAENTDGTYRYLMNLTQQVVNVGNGGTFSIRPNEGTTNNVGIDIIPGSSGNPSYMNIATRYYIGTYSANNAQNGLLFTHTTYNVIGAFYRFYFQGGTTTITSTTGITGGITYIDSFVPTSGTAVHNSLNLSPTINQTGGANGITRGLYVEPTLTSAADFRAIEVKAGSTSAHDLILLTNSAGNKVFEVNAAQQIGLFGVTPVSQPTTAITGATVTPGGGAPILEDDTFAGYTVAQIAQALVNLGILKP